MKLYIYTIITQTEKFSEQAVKRTLTYERGEKLKYDLSNLFMTVDDLIKDIGVKQSHVLLASTQDGEIIINMNKNRYSPIIRISNQHYFEKMSGYIFRKNTNPFLKNTFDKM